MTTKRKAGRAEKDRAELREYRWRESMRKQLRDAEAKAGSVEPTKPTVDEGNAEIALDQALALASVLTNSEESAGSDVTWTACVIAEKLTVVRDWFHGRFEGAHG